MVAHGFTARQLVALVRTGLATATTERVMAGKTPMQVTRVRITDAGTGGPSRRQDGPDRERPVYRG